jgi:hypothetical protein
MGFLRRDHEMHDFRATSATPRVRTPSLADDRQDRLEELSMKILAFVIPALLFTGCTTDDAMDNFVGTYTTTLTLSAPWPGAGGPTKLSFRHDQRNWAVHFVRTEP